MTKTIDSLPLYADDKSIGAAVLGTKRCAEFTGLAQVLEPKGMPKVNALMGGRYVPAVKAFLDHFEGLSKDRPRAPHGVENTSQWDRKTESKRPA